MSSRDACVRELVRELGDACVRVDAQSLERCAWDYGRMVRRAPALVVAVRSVPELLAALRIGASHGSPIVTRGSGHSMSGQGLAEGALALDMRSLCDVQIDAERGSAWLSGGATWHQATNAAFAHGLMPRGLTTIVDTTVGGTLSVGGVGGESFRTGTQADQVLELEVATLTDDVRLTRCSAEQNTDLFDAVRAGVGQCGVIVRARYPLRKAMRQLRTYTLACPDGRALFADMQAVSRAGSIDFMMGGLIWSEPRGWQVLLLLGKEHDAASELDDAALLAGLRSRQLSAADTPQWQLDGRPGHPFIRLFEEQDTPVLQRPWVDHVCEAEPASELLSQVLAEPMVAARARTSGVVLGIAAHAQRAPLFQPQTHAPLFLLGLSPEASESQLPAALSYVRRHNERGAALGAKRYMSGFMEGWTTSHWAEHFGAAWPGFHSYKQRFDPQRLLNNAHIRWP